MVLMPKTSSAKAKKRLRLMIGFIVGGILLLAGLGAVVFLNGQSQDLRQQAAVKQQYIVTCGGIPLGGFACASKTYGDQCRVCQVSSPGSPQGKWGKTADTNCVGMPCGPTPELLPNPKPGSICNFRPDNCPPGYFCSNAYVPRNSKTGICTKMNKGG
jgi:hypothetical protein